jgi:hypothetical protein
MPFWDGWFWIGEKIHLPDEISATEISLGRRRSLRALRKTKYKTLCVLGVLGGENLNSE